MAESTRFNLIMPKWLKDAMDKVAKELGVSTSEYVKDLIKHDIERRKGDKK